MNADIDQDPVDLSRWKAFMRSQHLSRHTITRRTGTILRIERLSHRPITELDVDWWQRYQENQRYSRATKRAYFDDIEAYFAWLNEDSRRRDDPDHLPVVSPLSGLRKPRPPKGRPRPIATWQLDAALRGASELEHDLITVGAYQALRISEAASVHADDVDVDGGTFRVLGKGDKDATIPLHPLVAEIAGRRGSGLWFPSKLKQGSICSGTVRNITLERFKAVGVKDFTFHRLRHWCATAMLRGGANLLQVQQFLRHENPATTAIYALVEMEDLRAASRLLPVLAGAVWPAAD